MVRNAFRKQQYVYFGAGINSSEVPWGRVSLLTAECEVVERGISNKPPALQLVFYEHLHITYSSLKINVAIE